MRTIPIIKLFIWCLLCTLSILFLHGKLRKLHCMWNYPDDASADGRVKCLADASVGTFSSDRLARRVYHDESVDGNANNTSLLTTWQDLHLYNTIDWHDEKGAVSVIHHMNPVRVQYIKKHLHQKQMSSSGRDDDDGKGTTIPVTALDLGCGSGIAAFELLTDVKSSGILELKHFKPEEHHLLRIKMMCVDIAEGALAQAKKRRDQLLVQLRERRNTLKKERVSVDSSIFKTLDTLEQNLSHMEFHQLSVYELASHLGQEKFDLIIASNVLNYFEDLPDALSNMSQVLKPQGLLYYDGFTRSLLSWVLISFVQLVGWIPERSFDWSMFIIPSELHSLFESNHLKEVDLKNIVPVLSITGFLEFLAASFAEGFIAPMRYTIADRIEFLEFMYAGIATKE